MFRPLTHVARYSLTGLSALGALSLYTARNEYNRAQLFAERMTEIYGKKLSGVRVCERPPRFKLLGWFNHFVPFHQSLVIPAYIDGPDVPVRHVGLGNALVSKKFRACQWRTHPDMPSISFPVEAWCDFKDTFGYFPQVDEKALVALNALTVSAEDIKSQGGDPDLALCPPFMSIAPNTDRFRIWHCRWAILDAIHRATTLSNIPTPIVKEQVETPNSLPK